MDRPFEELYLELSKNLLAGSLFYITEEIVGEMDKEYQSTIEGYTNQPIFLDAVIGPYLVEDELIAHKVLNKQLQLDRNIHELLKCQNGPENDFLLERYRDQVLGFWKITEWLSDNCQQRIHKLKKDHRNAFKLQVSQISRHYTELEKRFFQNNHKEANLNTTLEPKDIKNLQELIAPAKPFLEATETISEGEQVTSRKERLRNLKGKIEEDGERYILETVFNVKFDDQIELTHGQES